MLNANVPFKMKGQQHFHSLWCAIQTHLEIKWSFSVLYLPRVGLVKDLQKNNRTEEDVTLTFFLLNIRKIHILSCFILLYFLFYFNIILF